MASVNHGRNSGTFAEGNIEQQKNPRPAYSYLPVQLVTRIPSHSSNPSCRKRETWYILFPPTQEHREEPATEKATLNQLEVL